jgi:hexulose-6-phosphate isomerase
LGYDSREEFEAYGPHIKTVHIKDRKKGGSTVPLGTGNADFSQTFKLLAEQGFSGPLIFQAARQGDEVENARNLLRFVDPFLKFFH